MILYFKNFSGNSASRWQVDNTVESDRSYRLAIDGKRIDWPCRFISGSVVRQLGQIHGDKAIYFDRHDEADKLIEDH